LLSRSSRFDRAFGVVPWRAVVTGSRRLWASRQCRYHAWPPHRVLGAIGSKPRARPISISRPFYLFFSLSSSLAVSRCFSLLVVLVLRCGRAVRAGCVLGLSGAERRRSFLREGPNGVVLHVDCENSMLEFGMLPSPNGLVVPRFGVISGRDDSGTPPSTEDATYRGVVMMSRPVRPPLHRRDAQSFVRCSALEGLSRVRGETSQQRQGVRWAEETGR
ncbi:hypothetical protein Taro_008723, partial [Colocasia esculenta]|nr:hypothetical protein [Colocasia esculenta]